MKFKFDENLPTDLGEILRKDGHDAHSVHDESLCGATDRTIAKVCQDEQRILALIPRLLALLQTEPIERRLWIMNEHRTRIRGET